MPTRNFIAGTDFLSLTGVQSRQTLMDLIEKATPSDGCVDGVTLEVDGGKMQIAGGAVGESLLADGAVTEDKIATGAVTGDKIANGSITNAMLAGSFTMIKSVQRYNVIVGPGATVNQPITAVTMAKTFLQFSWRKISGGIRVELTSTTNVKLESADPWETADVSLEVIEYV